MVDIPVISHSHGTQHGQCPSSGGGSLDQDGGGRFSRDQNLEGMSPHQRALDSFLVI